MSKYMILFQIGKKTAFELSIPKNTIKKKPKHREYAEEIRQLKKEYRRVEA